MSKSEVSDNGWMTRTNNFATASSKVDLADMSAEDISYLMDLLIEEIVYRMEQK